MRDFGASGGGSIPTIPKPSDFCVCGKPAFIHLITVVNERNGQESTGPAGEYCDHVRGGLSPRGDYAFQRWESWCPNCYVGHKTAGRRTYSDDLVRVAWLWLMGEMAADTNLDGVFKRREVTDAQRDEYLRVVNHEAFRTRQPDAIPEKYQLAEVWG